MISITNIIKYIYYRIHDDSRHFSVSYDKQYKYLSRFKKPETEIERSFFQCKCALYIERFIVVFLEQIISSVFFIPYTVFLLFKKKKKPKSNTDYTAVLIDHANRFYYKELFASFMKIENVASSDNHYLRIKDVLFIIKLIYSHPLYPYWVIKNIYKIALYRFIVDMYNPKAIICSSEYSFTSSVLTYYCETYGIQHINIMHGEKFFFIQDAFFYFHKCYVWDECYIHLFKKLRAHCNQYIISIPENLKLAIRNDHTEFIYMITYYLAIESKEGLLAIKETLLKTQFKRSQIAIRYHPRYSEYFSLKLINTVFDGFVIEDPREVSLVASISMTKFVVSLYSTVLYQAYLSGKSIVIDDISFPDKYKQLKELDYIVFKKEYTCLSKFIH